MQQYEQISDNYAKWKKTEENVYIWFHMNKCLEILN